MGLTFLLVVAQLCTVVVAQCGAGECSTENSCLTHCDCRDCQPGHYCEWQWNLCTDKEFPCPAGRYQPSSRAQDCIVCPIGMYDDRGGRTDAAHTQCTECPTGQSQAYGGSTSCAGCAPGRIAPGTGNVECTQCDAGSYAAGSNAESCFYCPRGKYQASRGRSTCAGCSSGLYMALSYGSTTASDCLACTAGHYNSALDSSSGHECQACAAGRYSYDESSSCIQCLAGRFQPTPGQAGCIKCAGGRYQPHRGQAQVSACIDCDRGRYHFKEGVGQSTQGSFMESCLACPSGQAQSRPGQLACHYCPLGRRPDTQSHHCTIDCDFVVRLVAGPEGCAQPQFWGRDDTWRPRLQEAQIASLVSDAVGACDLSENVTSTSPRALANLVQYYRSHNHSITHTKRCVYNSEADETDVWSACQADEACSSIITYLRDVASGPSAVWTLLNSSGCVTNSRCMEVIHCTLPEPELEPELEPECHTNSLDESNSGVPECLELIESGMSCQDDFGPGGDHAGACNLACSFNMWDALDGIGQCDSAIASGISCEENFATGMDWHGWCDFACGYCSPAGASAQIHIQINTLTWANEISWNVDGGATFGPYEDNSVNDHVLDLPEGTHTFTYFDSYGDGWHGGYWSLINPADGIIIAGGPVDGVVSGSGGEVTFNVGAGGVAAVDGALDSPAPQIHIQINTLDWANEISWNVDGGATFGPYEDNSVNDHVLDLPEGTHTFTYFDSYGDGWHGGYWSLINPADGIIIAGGPVDGVVSGSGGEVTFNVGAGGVAAPTITTITVEIQTMELANQITWKLDGGPVFPADCPTADANATGNLSCYSNNSLYIEGPFVVPEGVHTISYHAPLGGGWSGGSWTVKNSSGTAVAEGVVAGAGGEDTFCVGECAGFVDSPQVTINVVVVSRAWGNEITCDIDGRMVFGDFRDDDVRAAVLQIPAGAHVFHYFDSYGDGWHGGYWIITDCAGTTIAGGPDNGVVEGDGGETEFTVQQSECPDLCRNNLCLNGGSCIPTVGDGFDCVCSGSFSGNMCERVVGCTDPAEANFDYTAVVDDGSCFTSRFPDPCNEQNPCLNSGSCVPTTYGVGFNCICPDGFSGSRCGHRVGCTDNDAANFDDALFDGWRNHHHRWDIANDGSCIYHQPDSTQCSNNPCLNDGSCTRMDGGLGFHCVCPAGFGGNRCERVAGCTDPTAINYDYTAVDDDGSCNRWSVSVQTITVTGATRDDICMEYTSEHHPSWSNDTGACPQLLGTAWETDSLAGIDGGASTPCEELPTIFQVCSRWGEAVYNWVRRDRSSCVVDDPFEQDGSVLFQSRYEAEAACARSPTCTGIAPRYDCNNDGYFRTCSTPISTCASGDEACYSATSSLYTDEGYSVVSSCVFEKVGTANRMISLATRARTWLDLASDYMMQTADENAAVIARQLCDENGFVDAVCVKISSGERQVLLELTQQSCVLADHLEKRVALGHSGSILNTNQVQTLTYREYENLFDYFRQDMRDKIDRAGLQETALDIMAFVRTERVEDNQAMQSIATRRQQLDQASADSYFAVIGDVQQAITQAQDALGISQASLKQTISSQLATQNSDLEEAIRDEACVSDMLEYIPGVDEDMLSGNMDLCTDNFHAKLEIAEAVVKTVSSIAAVVVAGPAVATLGAVTAVAHNLVDDEDFKANAFDVLELVGQLHSDLNTECGTLDVDECERLNAAVNDSRDSLQRAQQSMASLQDLMRLNELLTVRGSTVTAADLPNIAYLGMQLNQMESKFDVQVLRDSAEHESTDAAMAELFSMIQQKIKLMKDFYQAKLAAQDQQMVQDLLGNRIAQAERDASETDQDAGEARAVLNAQLHSEQLLAAQLLMAQIRAYEFMFLTDYINTAHFLDSLRSTRLDPNDILTVLEETQMDLTTQWLSETQARDNCGTAFCSTVEISLADLPGTAFADTGSVTLSIQPPEAPGYSHLVYGGTPRVFLMGLDPEHEDQRVGITFWKLGISTMVDGNANLWTFTHQESNPPMSCEYNARDCEVVSQASCDAGATTNFCNDDTPYMTKGPYGVWRVQVNTPHPDLTSVSSIKFVFNLAGVNLDEPAWQGGNRYVFDGQEQLIGRDLYQCLNDESLPFSQSALPPLPPQPPPPPIGANADGADCSMPGLLALLDNGLEAACAMPSVCPPDCFAVFGPFATQCYSWARSEPSMVDVVPAMEVCIDAQDALLSSREECGALIADIEAQGTFEVGGACCPSADVCDSDSIPTFCTSECAVVMSRYFKRCSRWVESSRSHSALAPLVAKCEDTVFGQYTGSAFSRRCSRAEKDHFLTTDLPAACCGSHQQYCPDGNLFPPMPRQCSVECASEFEEFYAECHPSFDGTNEEPVFSAFLARCQGLTDQGSLCTIGIDDADNILPSYISCQHIVILLGGLDVACDTDVSTLAEIMPTVDPQTRVATLCKETCGTCLPPGASDPHHTPQPHPCMDIDGDGYIGVHDLLEVLAAFGGSASYLHVGFSDHGDLVDVTDILNLLPDYGRDISDGNCFEATVGEMSEYLDAVVTTLEVSTPGYITYRLTASLHDTAANLYSVEGTADGPMQIPAAHQVAAPFGVDVGGVHPAFFPIRPDAAYDSWLTIGFTDGSGSKALSTIGIDFASWTETVPLFVDNGSVFLMDPNSAPSGDVVVAQLTVRSGSSGTVLMGMQGHASGGGDWDVRAVVFSY